MNAPFREQVHLYCEGLLPEYAEAAFFAELSHNSDLRLEMNTQLKLINAVKSHAATIQLPSDAKETLFAALGARISPHAASNIASATSVSQAASYGINAPVSSVGTPSSLATTLTVSLCSSAVTAVIILLLLQSGWMLPIGGKSTAFAHNQGFGSLPPIQDFTMLHTPFANAPIVYNDTIRETRTIVRYVPNNRSNEAASTLQFGESSTEVLLNTSVNNDSLKKNAQPEHSILTQPAETALSPQSVSSNVLTNAAQQFEGSSATENPEFSSPFNVPQKQHSSLGIIATVRGVRSRSFPEATVGSESYPIFNNTAFSVMIPLSATSAVGVEAGQEAYFLRYRTQFPEMDYPMEVEKNPVFAWAGLTYRHTFLPDNVFSPFVSITLGGVSIGAMGRTFGGLQYSIDTRTRCILGVEASSLLYIHRNIWNFSPNLGISYGISVEL